ncbi:hypothetical protein IU440_27875 [Nocardia cyriacigeorgica]|uniref:hypothetical protein n=1 Tax=Nocardia cyriacigeorgica TaxID=135487 RepID=UPI0018930968|nr:hypothetical protein [Nocardia cyriacigeorgica]MBF6428503.1 hypothetical protein [Nocardia cyriacigeorgica]
MPAGHPVAALRRSGAVGGEIAVLGMLIEPAAGCDITAGAAYLWPRRRCGCHVDHLSRED